MTVKYLISLCQVSMNLLELDGRVLLSVSARRVFQDAGKAKLRRRYLGSSEYAERLGSKKQVFDQTKKMTKRKAFLEDLLWQQTFFVCFKNDAVLVKQRYWDSQPFGAFGMCGLWKKYCSTCLKTLTMAYHTYLEVRCNLAAGVLGLYFIPHKFIFWAIKEKFLMAYTMLLQNWLLHFRHCQLCTRLYIQY